MAVAKKIQIYDTTLRDGCQSEDVSLTIADKLLIAERLDDLGVDYIEGGWPGSNDRDAAFFIEVKKLRLRHAKVAAFGSTRRANVRCAADRNLQLLLRAETQVATVVGKTWDLHVRDALRISQQENLDILHDTIAYLKQHVGEVIFDAEHFFDGFSFDRDFALACLKAVDAGKADLICLCDTNGGRLPHEVEAAVRAACETVGCAIGIHCHNDSEVAVANSIAAVRAGAVQVQGTINGVGERCGNANLVSVIANLQLKLGYHCVPPPSSRRCAPLPGWSTNWRILRHLRGNRTWAAARLRIRPGCTSRESSATPRPTSISSPSWWATIAASCSPSSPAAPI